MQNEIIFLSSDSNHSGAPVHLYHLVKGLVGLDIKIITPRGWLGEELSEEGFKVMYVKWGIRNVMKLRRYFMSKPSAVLHFQGVKSLVWGGVASLGLPNKKIYTEHLWTKDFHLANRLRETLQLLAIRYLIDKVNTVICVSKAVENFYKDRLKVPAEKLVTIHNGVEFYDIKNESTQFAFAFIGSLNKNKNVSLIIEAFSQLDSSSKLIIIGNGPEEEILKTLVTELNLNDRVEFIPETSNIESILKRINVVVSASKSESFGMGLLEALGSGIPVLAPDIEALKEVITEPDFLYRKNNKKSLINKMKDIEHNFEKYSAKAKTYSEFVRANYNFDQMIAKYQTFYQLY